MKKSIKRELEKETNDIYNMDDGKLCLKHLPLQFRLQRWKWVLNIKELVQYILMKYN